MRIEPKSQILISHDPATIIEELQERYSPEQLIIIERDEFKVEDAKEAMQRAYVAANQERFIVLSARKYNIYAQNAMLKILEEPPKRTHFILIVPSKSLLLPTILSRLPLVQLEESAVSEAVHFEEFDLEVLYNLTQKAKEFSKPEAVGVVRGMLEFALRKGYKLSQKELDYFGNAVKLLELNSNPANVFITAGLILLGHKKRGK